jgi:hypothetical protein
MSRHLLEVFAGGLAVPEGAHEIAEFLVGDGQVALVVAALGLGAAALLKKFL